jgi:hypothetical protein
MHYIPFWQKMPVLEKLRKSGTTSSAKYGETKFEWNVSSMVS